MHVDPDQYVLFSCEGTAERFILHTLIERDELIVPKERIVRNRTDGGWAVGRSRTIIDSYLDADYGDRPLRIVRMVDSESDRYRPPRGYEHMAEVTYLRTRPEIEMLVIISEGRYGRYTNASKRLKPSDYCRSVIGYGQVKKWGWLEGYWAEPGRLEQALADYARLHRFARNENRGLLELLDE